MSKQVLFKKLHADATIPSQGSKFSVGYDVSAIEDVEIEPNKSAQVKIGLAMALPPYHWCKIVPRSSHGFTKGVIELAGVIDEDYRGEIGIKIMNLSDKPYRISKGERFAQMLILERPDLEVLEVSELDYTKRGTGGFGSTGR